MDGLLSSVADATDRCAYTIWGFGVGPALTALVRAGVALDRPDLVDGVGRRVATALTAPAGPTDHLICVETLVELATRRPEYDVRAAVERFTAALLGVAGTALGGPGVHRPDLDRWGTTVWVDCMHTDGPGLSLAGRPAAAVRLLRTSAAALQRPDGLFDHGYDVALRTGNGVAWGRGQGWALLGLVGTLSRVSDVELRRRLERLVAALARHELDGRWRTVVDDPAAPVEMSTSAFVALAVGRAVRAGLVEPAYGELAERALGAALGAVVDGVLPTSGATPVGATSDYYTQPVGAHPWGQGPLLAALLDRADTIGRTS